MIESVLVRQAASDNRGQLFHSWSNESKRLPKKSFIVLMCKSQQYSGENPTPILVSNYLWSCLPTTGRFKSCEIGPVILSAAKNLCRMGREILRCAQNDRAI